MPTLESEIELIEFVSGAKVIAITLNHEDMTDVEIDDAVMEYESRFGLPTTDVLIHGCDKIIEGLLMKFPTLRLPRLVDSARPEHTEVAPPSETVPLPVAGRNRSRVVGVKSPNIN
jgi:hypothetical protein